MFLFFHLVVPLGKVPSTGMALTGNSSPRPSIILAVNSRTNFGALSGTVGRISQRRVAFAALAKGFVYCLLNRCDGFFWRQNACNGKEGSLHNCADASTQACLARDLHCINNKESQFVGNDLLLYFANKLRFFVIDA